MLKCIKRWLIKHLSFNTYLIFATTLEAIEQKLDLAKYALFTHTNMGSCLQGTAFPRIHRVTSGAVSRSLPYLIILAALLCIPTITPQCIATAIEMADDASAVSGFITAILAVAGIFLTLFYTNVTTVFSTKYPSSTGNIPKLFVSLVSSDKNLKYCTSFVIISSFSFIACIAQWFNWLAFAYVFILAIVLIGRIPSIFALSAGRTDITAVASIPANRFLALAKAASFDKPLFATNYLTQNLKNLALNNLKLINELMDYSLSAGDYASAYSKAINDIVLETLVKYTRIAQAISTESHWHTETTHHKAWFTSHTFELDHAISTGTIPQPSRTIDPLGHQRELHRIANKYGKHLTENGTAIEYSNYFATSTFVLKCSIEYGGIEWAKEYSEFMLNQCRDYCFSLDDTDASDLQVKLSLLEQYAAMLMAIPFELRNLCDAISPDAFHFDSFRLFTQAELQKQGFPLGSDTQMRTLCKKLEYEIATFGMAETPKWWFDKNVNSLAVDSIEQLCSWLLILHDDFCSMIKTLSESDAKASYILPFKEAELYRKSENCIHGFLELINKNFGEKNLAKDYLTELENIHNDLVRTFPDLAKSFMKECEEYESLLPDLYGFAFFNYCQLVFEDIVNCRLASFCTSITPLYHLTIISSVDLQKTMAEGSRTDIYNAQILIEPTVFFLELCGMAYAMAELSEDWNSQCNISDQVSSILETNPKEHTRWTACISVCSDIRLNSKIYMDLFKWRSIFLQTIEDSGLYPDIPRYPFGISDRKPPAGKERLLEMLPISIFELNDFNGCKIFKKYLLKMDDYD